MYLLLILSLLLCIDIYHISTRKVTLQHLVSEVQNPGKPHCFVLPSKELQLAAAEDRSELVVCGQPPLHRHEDAVHPGQGDPAQDEGRHGGVERHPGRQATAGHGSTVFDEREDVGQNFPACTVYTASIDL